jgi:hypothetical protein
MESHKFSKELPIEELCLSYLNVSIRGKTLEFVLHELAYILDTESSKLQPTTAQHSYQYMKLKFEYIIEQLIGSHHPSEIEVIEKKKYFWELVNQLKTARIMKNLK